MISSLSPISQDFYISFQNSADRLFRLEAERLAAECNMKLYRTSVKEDLNVAVVFQHLAENYVNKVSRMFLMIQ